MIVDSWQPRKILTMIEFEDEGYEALLPDSRSSERCPNRKKAV
jgi:hypothetical protein